MKTMVVLLPNGGLSAGMGRHVADLEAKPSDHRVLFTGERSA